MQALFCGAGNGDNDCTVWLLTKVSDHRNLGARSLLHGHDRRMIRSPPVAHEGMLPMRSDKPFARSAGRRTELI